MTNTKQDNSHYSPPFEEPQPLNIVLNVMKRAKYPNRECGMWFSDTLWRFLKKKTYTLIGRKCRYIQTNAKTFIPILQCIHRPYTFFAPLSIRVTYPTLCQCRTSKKQTV